MEDIIDYPVDPIENQPIWTQLRTTEEDFFLFDHELTVEVEALPTFSRPCIPSFYLPKEVSTIQDYTSPPLLPGSLIVSKHLQDPVLQTLGQGLGSIHSTAGPDKPLEGYLSEQEVQTLTLSTPLHLGTPLPGNFMGIGIM